jgi:hypothetical protein
MFRDVMLKLLLAEPYLTRSSSPTIRIASRKASPIAVLGRGRIWFFS